MKVDRGALQETFIDIISVESSDGFDFTFDSIEQLSQPHMDYPGYRVHLKTGFAKMKDTIHIDVGVGDVVEPLFREIPLSCYRGKPFFERTVSLLIYPAETIFSEKLETILSKGSGNSRMKDYHDLVLLLRNGESILNLEKLRDAVKNTFSHRGTHRRLIEFDESSLGTIQRLWTAHLQGLGEQAKNFSLPEEISAAIEEINKYLVTVFDISKIDVVH